MNGNPRRQCAAEPLGSVSCAGTNVHLVGSIGAYCGIVIGAVEMASPAIWAAAWVGMAFLLFGILTVMHEAAHGNLYRSRHANRLAGVMAGCAVLLCWSVYRSFHLQHHGATCTALDPERRPRRLTNIRECLLLLVLGPLFVLGMWRYTGNTLRGRPPFFLRTAAARGLVGQEMRVMVIIYALLVPTVVTHPLLILKIWLVPLIIMYVYVFPLVTVPEHLHGPADVSAYESTRTVTSNAALRWAVWNANYHTAHHLAPGVPFHALPRLDGRVVAEVKLRETSYLRFYWKLFRSVGPASAERPGCPDDLPSTK